MERLFRQHFYLVGRWHVRDIVGYVLFDVDSVVKHLAIRSMHVADDAVQKFGARWCVGLAGTAIDRGHNQ